MKKSIIASLCVLGLVVGCDRPGVRQVSEEFNQTPLAVQKSVREHAPQGEIVSVDKQSRNGIATYVIKFRDSQRHPAMEVAADGTLVRYEAGTAALGRPGAMTETERGSAESNPYSALPVGVQKAIIEHAPRAEAVDLQRREENGQLIYEIKYSGSEPRPVLHVTSDGRVLKKPEDVAPAK